MRQFLPLSFLLLTPAHGAESAPPELGASLATMVAGLFIVLALLMGALWLLKRVQAPGGASPRVVRIIGGAMLGARERIVVVEIGESWLALGVAPGQVSLLCELPKQTLPAADPPPDFSQRLLAALRRHAS
ncbi:MAG: flagellar biosynthetic protein FliO [Rhodocyclaceae bacterium]|nr:flagellar biosynthetic protein FliO [Rhodocyclaceae bacterium]